MNKKVLVISQPELAVAVGGSCSINYDLCNLLISNGYEVTDIVFSEHKIRPKGFDNQVHFVNLYDKNESFSQELDKYLTNNIPDLVIFFFPSLYVEAGLSEKYKNVPRILMFHSRPDYYFSKNYYLSENSVVNKLESMYVNTVAQILFPSYFDLLPNYIKTSVVTCIPNYSKLSQQIDLKTEKKKIVYLSRIDAYKQPEFLINSFRIIADKALDWTLDIYGQGTEDYLKHLNMMIYKFRLEGRVNLKGVTDDPIKILSNYDFCVFPSSFEGFPMGLVEAQSVGLPSIGLKKCSGVNELIIDGYNGLLTEYSENDFAEAMLKMIKSPKLRAQFSVNTYSYVRNFSKEVWDFQWLQLIKNIIEKNRIKPVKKESSKRLFSLKELDYIAQDKVLYSFMDKIFSIKNLGYRIVIHILGIKISIRRKVFK